MTFLRSIRSDLLNPRILPLLGVLLPRAGGGRGLYRGRRSKLDTPADTCGGRHEPFIRAGWCRGQPGAGQPHEAVSETTSGLKYQHQGSSHNPFKPLVVAKIRLLDSATTTPKVSSISDAEGFLAAEHGSSGTSEAPPLAAQSPSQSPSSPRPSIR